jgi:hypothetical protein
MSLDPHDPELAGLEAALSALTPMPGQINRDALLFRAGQASVCRRTWGWPCATAALGLAAAALAVVVASRPAPTERIVVVTIKEPTLRVNAPDPPTPEHVPSAASQALAGHSPMNYLQLERQVLRWGLDGLPATPSLPSSSVPPLTRDSLLGTAAAPSSPPKFFSLESYFQ